MHSKQRVSKLYCIIAIGLMVLTVDLACTTKLKKQSSENRPSFNLPTIPAMLTTAELRAEFLVVHYWDNFDFSDTTYLREPEVTEQTVVDYINLFPHTSLKTVSTSISSMLNKSIEGDKAMYDYFAELYEKYLYDPNSPFRNEDYYIPVLRSIVNSEKIEEIDKVRARYQLEMAMKNRPGDIATDFELVLKNGWKMRLSDVKSNYTILFFNNPDCQDCARVKAILSQLSNPKIKIVAIYPDEDIELWQKTKYPTDWIDGCNTSIRTENSYDLRAIPNLYLLDEDKRVKYKDIPIESLINYLKGQL